MNALQEKSVDVANKDGIYENIMEIYHGGKINKRGIKKSHIEHGDYGYFSYEGKTIERLFLKTTRNRIEAFCVKPAHYKCAMGADVNKNPSQYYICGNIFV